MRQGMVINDYQAVLENNGTKHTAEKIPGYNRSESAGADIEVIYCI